MHCPLLGNGLINTFDTKATVEVLLEAAFFIRCVSRQYGESRQSGAEVTGVSCCHMILREQGSRGISITEAVNRQQQVKT